MVFLCAITLLVLISYPVSFPCNVTKDSLKVLFASSTRKKTLNWLKKKKKSYLLQFMTAQSTQCPSHTHIKSESWNTQETKGDIGGSLAIPVIKTVKPNFAIKIVYVAFLFLFYFLYFCHTQWNTIIMKMIINTITNIKSKLTSQPVRVHNFKTKILQWRIDTC